MIREIFLLCLQLLFLYFMHFFAKVCQGTTSNLFNIICSFNKTVKYYHQVDLALKGYGSYSICNIGPESVSFMNFPIWLMINPAVLRATVIGFMHFRAMLNGDKKIKRPYFSRKNYTGSCLPLLAKCLRVTLLKKVTVYTMYTVVHLYCILAYVCMLDRECL